MCLTFKHLFKHLVNKGHSIPVLVYLQDFYNNTRYCYELKCGPGQRGLSGHSQRFPSLECEAYPRDLLVDCVWFKRAFTLVSEKRWHHNCHRLWWHCACRFLRSLFLHFVMCLFGVRCCSTSFSLWSWDVATFALNPYWLTEHGVHACVSWGEPSHYTRFHTTCSSLRPTPSALQLFRNT